MVLKKNITANTLKIIAITSMFIDHLGSWLTLEFSLSNSFIHIIGRLAAPIMCYLVAEGFFYTSNVKKYIGRIVLFAVISHIPYILYFQFNFFEATSVMWSLALGLMALTIVENKNYSNIIKIVGVIACCILAIPANWNYIGVLWILFFGICRGSFKMQMISFSLVGLVVYAVPQFISGGWTFFYRFAILLAIPLLAKYNGEKGKAFILGRWGFYLFYPAHLLVLYILRYIIF